MVENLLRCFGFIGSGVCHQKIGLSFFSEEIYLPLCSRCTGIYAGFLLSVLFILIIERKIKASPPSNRQLIFVITVLMLMGVDVALTTYSVIEPNNYIRFITGFLTGWSLSLIFIPLLNMAMLRRALKKTYLQKKKNLVFWLSACILFGALFIFSYREAIIFWSVFTIIGTIVFYTFVLLIIIFLSIKKISNEISSIKIFIPVFLGGMLFSTFLISGIAVVRNYL